MFTQAAIPTSLLERGRTFTEEHIRVWEQLGLLADQ